MVEFLLADDATPLDVAALSGFQAGAPSDPLELHLWNEKEYPLGEDLRDLLVVLYAEDPQQPGTWQRAGLPPLDELWARVRVVGQNRDADPTQQPFTTDWRTLGATRALALPSLHAGCARHLELRLHPPSTAQAAAWRFRLAVLYGEHALGAPQLEQERGIVAGVGDPARSGLWRGGEITTSDPPDDRLRVAPWQALIRGRLVGRVGEELTLDQVDGASELLEPGESYWALIAASTEGLVVRRGLRAVEPEKPGPEPRELLLRWVRVGHEPGGISAIDAADLDGETLYDRHAVRPGTGLEVRVHPGEAIAHGTRRLWSSVAALPVPPSKTSHLWQLGDGRWEITESDEPPEDTALGPLAEIVAGEMEVEEIVDRRPWAAAPSWLELKGAPGASPGPFAERLVLEDLEIERVVCRASDAGSGTAGATVIDIEIAGATIYPSQALDDQRPHLAVGAAERIFEAGIHELSGLRAGETLTVRTAEHPDGAPPANLEVHMLVWRRS